MMARGIFALFLLLLPTIALGNDTWAVVSGRSYHFERDGQLEWNIGVGIEREVNERWRWLAGGYNNSSGDASFYAAVAYLPWRFWGARAGAILGGVTGYTNHDPSALGGLALSLDGKTQGVNVLFVPAAGGLLFIQWKARF
jgi:hypothetical protein